MKVLIVVESPSKSKTIEKYLNESPKKEGAKKKNEFTVLASYGHVVDLAKGGKFGIGVDLTNGLKPRYLLQEDKKEVFNKIVDAAANSDLILLASDPDREGEAIAYHLLQRLLSVGKPIKRIQFNEITKPALLAALKSPRDIDMNLFYSQQARRILDRVVGFMVSPFLREVYEQNLSAGRVQSVVIRMIVDRENEIKTFVPKEYWNVFAELSTPAGEKFKVKYDGTINNKAEADSIIADLQSNTFVVSTVKRSPKKENPPPPLTTLVLQQLASKKFGFSAEQTMTAAQALYEGGYTTYIRTDSVRITDEAIKSIRGWIGNNNYALPAKPYVYEAKESSADSHEAIRCTNVNNVPGQLLLTGDESQLYELIWRYSVASQMAPAVWDTLEVRIKCGKHELRVSGKALSDKGYLEILGFKDSKIDIPNMNKGDVVTLASPQSVTGEQKFTQPPGRYSESKLIEELDKRQIGRPSTMATILKNIISRNYVQKNGNIYTPTDLGIQITKTLEKYFGFLNFNYSASMEKKLDLVAAGQENYDTLMSDFYSTFSKELEAAIVENSRTACPRCHGVMIQRENTRGKYFSCSGCNNFLPIAA